jgi:hypothetical protein
MVKTFEVEGVLTTMHNEHVAEREIGQCLCCRPHPHVFAYGVEMPGEDRWGQSLNPDRWVHDQLYELRFHPGAKVTITVTVDTGDIGQEIADVVAASPENVDA